MRRLIDAIALKEEHEKAMSAYSDCWTGEMRYGAKNVVQYATERAPTIQTKDVKYFDEDENVWKIGSVIVE